MSYNRCLSLRNDEPDPGKEGKFVSATPPEEVTTLLVAWSDGDPFEETIRREWVRAKAFLHRELTKE